MAKRYLWPVCDAPDCGHHRTYTDQAALDRDMTKHGEQWTQEGGWAFCACHTDQGRTFPCDPVDTWQESRVCAACGAEIIRAPDELAVDYAGGWRHLETKRDYRHAAWPVPVDDDGQPE